MSSASELTGAIVAAQSAAVVVINEKAASDSRVIELMSALDDADQNLQIAVDALAELRTEFDAYKAAHPDTEPPPPDPEPTTTLIGATVGANDGGLNVTADIRRVFTKGPLPADFGQDASSVEASRRTRPGGVVWASYKGPVTETDLRTALRSMSDYLESKGQFGCVTYEHEPDAKTVIPSTVYHAGYDLLERVIVEFPRLKPRVILTGFKGDNGDTTSWETYWRPGHDVIGADHYNRGHQQVGEPFRTPAENYGRLVSWAKSKGKPLAIGETGVGDDAVPGTVIKTRPDWYKAHRDYVQDPANNIVAACAYDARDALLDGPSARAWYGV